MTCYWDYLVPLPQSLMPPNGYSDYITNFRRQVYLPPHPYQEVRWKTQTQKMTLRKHSTVAFGVISGAWRGESAETNDERYRLEVVVTVCTL